jgi:heat-inducible transcriptional repressor
MIREAYVEGPGDVEDLLKRSSRILSSASRQVGVVLWPKSALMRIRHLQFIRMRPYLIMLVLVTQSGLVHHRVLDWEEDIVQDDLDKYSRYVNELLEDVPLGEVKQRIMEEMQKEKVLFDELYMNALRISRRALEDTLEQANVFVDGQSNLFHNPEFADVKRMHRLLETFEDKSRIVRLLDMALESVGEPRIILGPETELDDFGEIGLISYPYRRGDTTLGVIGVMGPLRMEYSRIVPVVDFTAAILSSLLEGSDRI